MAQPAQQQRLCGECLATTLAATRASTLACTPRHLLRWLPPAHVDCPRVAASRRHAPALPSRLALGRSQRKRYNHERSPPLGLATSSTFPQVFFIRDGMKFPDMVHSLKPNPKNHIQARQLAATPPRAT